MYLTFSLTSIFHLQVKVIFTVVKQLKQLQRKPRNKDFNKKEGFNGIRAHNLCDTGAMLYQLSYEASLEADQDLPVIWREWNDVYMI